MERVKHDITIILINKNFSLSFKIPGVIGQPPIMKVAFFIVLTAPIIETVCHFVRYNHSNSAIVYGIVSIHKEEWRLQNCCREDNFIHIWAVICVDGLWC